MDSETTSTSDSETTSEHRVELRRTYTRGALRYWGRCSCGESSPVFPTAGMVWGWETGHRDSETT